MSDRTVRAILDAQVSGFVAGMTKAATVAQDTGKKITDGIDKASKSVKAHEQEWKTVSNGMLIGGAAIAGGLALSTKAAMDWEKAFAGVAKTVGLTDPGLKALEGDLRGLAREMATSHEEIAQVAESAGALGVKTQDIAGFTKTMLMLGETTNLSADQAATSLAQLMTIMGTAPSMVGRMGATLVALGNNGASTEAQIVQLSQRIAAAGRQMGMSESQVMGFASAIASTGVEVEAGGTAMSQGLIKISAAVREGGDGLKTLSAVAGVDFKKAFEQDAAGATTAFIEGLGKLQKQGGDVDAVLSAIGIDGIRGADTFKRLALSGGLLAEQLQVANTGMRDGTALLDAYAARQGTASAKVAVALNNVKDAGISFGAQFLPVVANVANAATNLAPGFGTLPGPMQAFIGTGAAVTAGALLIGGGLIKAATAGSELYASYTKLATEHPKLAKVLRNTAIAAAAAGVAFTAWQVIAANASAVLQKTITSTHDVSAAIMSAANAGKSFDLNKVFKFEEGVLLIDKVNGVGDALKRVLDPSMASGASEMMNGAASMITRIKTQFSELDKTLSGLSATGAGAQAAETFRVVAEAAKASGADMSRLSGIFPQYRSQLEGIANQLNINSLSEADYVDWMGGKVPAAIQAATSAGSGMSANLTEQQKGLLGVKLAAIAAAKSMTDYANIVGGLAGTESGARSSLADTKKGVKAGAGTNLTTEAGRENDQFLRTGAEAINAYAQKLKDAGASTQTITEKTAGMREELVQSAAKALKSRDAAELYTAGLLAIPGEVAPTFSTPGAAVSKAEADAMKAAALAIPSVAETQVLAPGARPSKAEVDDFIKTLGNIPPEKVAAIRTVAELAGIDAAKAGLASIRDKVVTITTRLVTVGNSTMGGLVQNAANGGIFEFYAGGGMRENHVAQIAPAGAWRVWAEEETGGESYIPLAESKRTRSVEIWKETGRRLGQPVPYFNGGVNAAPAASGEMGTNGSRPAVIHLYGTDGLLRETFTGWLGDSAASASASARRGVLV